MTITQISKLNFSQNFLPLPFSIRVTYGIENIDISFIDNSQILNTKFLPNTNDILKNSIPGIFNHRCYNNGNIPFAKEVLRTETGHLFEHIVIEYLRLLNIKNLSLAPKIYKGETSWNWGNNPRGLFNITINVKIEEKEIFLKALEQSEDLMLLIFGFNPLQNDSKIRPIT